MSFRTGTRIVNARSTPETLGNRLSRIKKRAAILEYQPDKDPASLAREPDRELLEHCRVTGQQIGALWAARHRGLY